ncbi:MAG: hypothetical protein JNJ54_33235 [Myxococcaceae bacterium]|nr:hypothetical protein [Myxococcaceae bacterium]
MTAPTEARPAPFALIAVALSLLVVPLNCVVFYLMLDGPRSELDTWLVLFLMLAGLQFVFGVVAVVAGVIERRRNGQGGLGPIIFGSLSALGAPAGAVGAVFLSALSSMGGAWGRPLRVKGRQLHPNLREGADWTDGDRPEAGALAEADRRALEALWLHDAQKEHASVPAFSRISWLLAAVGAPAELMTWSHRAAMEEIDHARRCFALAAGYGGRTFTVEPMPDLLLGALELKDDPLVTLAVESVSDGCQLEDFNADVAGECATVCEEPATKRLLEQIAREERSHADFSWALVEWLVQRDAPRVVPALARAVERLEGYPRPTAVSAEKQGLVAKADASVLRRHGRLPDERWAALWDVRLAATRDRVQRLLGGVQARAA